MTLPLSLHVFPPTLWLFLLHALLCPFFSLYVPLTQRFKIVSISHTHFQCILFLLTPRCFEIFHYLSQYVALSHRFPCSPALLLSSSNKHIILFLTCIFSLTYSLSPHNLHHVSYDLPLFTFYLSHIFFFMYVSFIDLYRNLCAQNFIFKLMLTS